MADHVVLTIPFTTLRNVDLTGVTISALKRQAIAGLPLGNNVKLQIQVAKGPWKKDGYSGDTLTDAPFDGSWDGSSYQNDGGKADTEILIAVPGGSGRRRARVEIRSHLRSGAGTGAGGDDQ